MPDFTKEQVLERARRGLALDRADLRGLDLSGAPLEGVSFRRSELDGTRLEHARLKGANLSNASLKEAYCAGADFSGVNLEKADLESVNLKDANLQGAQLTRVNLEGATLENANLSGAMFGFAQLDSANLGGANLAGATVTHADLTSAYLGGAKLYQTNLGGSNLKSANLEEADLREAVLTDADLSNVRAVGARFSSAWLSRANLTGADLTRADLSAADLRNANLQGSNLREVVLTGAKVFGWDCRGATHGRVVADWLDGSPEGDGSVRWIGKQLLAVLAGQTPSTLPQPSLVRDGLANRYFGRGDVLKDASLEFDSSANVEIDSRFERCQITLKPGAQLLIGREGVLKECSVLGAGKIIVHGFFSEGGAPGIVGPSHLIISAQGAVNTRVQQSEQPTVFAFEPGCRLRMKIHQVQSATATDIPSSRGTHSVVELND